MRACSARAEPCRARAVIAGALLAACLQSATADEAEWSGYIAAEARLFPHDAVDPDQFDGAQVSLALEPEYYRRWDDGRQSFTFRPFLRLDQRDAERTHADIRELAWLMAADSWELRAGIRKVFWGVTETAHLVDIVNQTDLVENIDTEDKLGQPMLNLALIRDWGNLDLYLLPGFRERTFPGEDGRLRTPLPVDTDLTRYESAAEERRVDTALRWFRTQGIWDIGLAHFHGTSREPQLLPAVNGQGEAVFAPYYPIIDQTSLDVQATLDAWLWKLEWITRDGLGDRYSAFAGGFEYTFVGVFGSTADVGLIGEYLFDDRDAEATTLFQDDVTVGLRLAMNDMQSSELLFGMTIDRRDTRQRFYNLEASRRLGDRWKLSVEARFNSGFERSLQFNSLRNDDYVQAELAWYF
jgi:hypothetical protein